MSQTIRITKPLKLCVYSKIQIFKWVFIVFVKTLHVNQLLDFHSHGYTVLHVNIILFIQKTGNKKVGVGEADLGEGIIIRRI